MKKLYRYLLTFLFIVGFGVISLGALVGLFLLGVPLAFCISLSCLLLSVSGWGGVFLADYLLKEHKNLTYE